MNNNDKRYEQAISKVLSEHVEQQVPENTDLWPLIERRLAMASSESDVNQPMSFLPVRPSTSDVQGKQRVFRPNRLRTGLVAFLVIAVVSVLAFSLLATREEQVISPDVPTPTAVETPSLNGEATYLFSIPTGGNDVHYERRDGSDDHYSLLEHDRSSLYGFDVADDGSFWIGGTDGRLLQYSATGRRMRAIQLAPHVGQLDDLKIQGSTIWIAYKYAGISADKLSLGGTLLEHYTPIVSYPGDSDRIQRMNPQFIEGGNGQMLLTLGSQYIKIENVDMIKTGREMTTLEGFPGKEKVYKRSQEGPPNVIMVGNRQVNIELPGINVIGAAMGWSILKEMPDGSFYLSAGVEARDVPGTPNGMYSYILHFGADGKLIERARVPSTDRYGRLPLEITIAPDGQAYVLRVPDSLQTSSKVDRLDVLRLNFYPASEALPPVPTHTPTPVLPTPVPTAVRPPMSFPPAVSTGMAAPTATLDTTPLELVPHADGFRLQGLPVRDRVSPMWLDGSRFIVPLSQPTIPYLVADLDAGKLTRHEVPEPAGHHKIIPNLDGSYALLLWDTIQTNETPTPAVIATLLQTQSGYQQTLIDTNSRGPQVAGPDELSWQFGGSYNTLTAVWIDNNTYLLTRTPSGDGESTIRGWEGWGKIFIGDVAKGTLRVLTERGDVIGVLPDGSLLLRRGWIDGAVHLLPPPYTEEGTEVLPSGTWRTAWALSPDGSRLAWFDVQPSPGDWSRDLPTSGYSDDPQPTVTQIAFWERAGGKVQRFPVQDVQWSFASISDMFVAWRKDSSALLYVSHPPEVVFTDLTEITLDGKTTHLARNDGNFIYGIRAEAADGSLYVETTSDRQHSERLIRTLPGGGSEVVCAYIDMLCALDRSRLITIHGKELEIKNLTTGSTKRVSFHGKEEVIDAVSNTVSHNVMLSPDGGWLAVRDPNNGTFHFLRIKD